MLWTVAGGSNTFGPAGEYSYATAANSNGTIVVGKAGNTGSGDGYAALWNLSGSPTLTSLGILPGFTNSVAYSVSDNGQVVVGSNGGSGGTSAAFRWTAASGMTDLGFLNQGDTGAEARFVSGNGQYIVGFTDSGGFVWTELEGMVSATDYLTAGGVDLTGCSSLVATSITDDGTYLAGYGHRDGLYEGFVAQVVPEPSTYALLALSAAGLGAHVLRRRRK